MDEQVDEQELTIRDALARAVPGYLELLELAPAVLAAAVPDELQELRSSASQLGVSLTALSRRFASDRTVNQAELQLLRELAESLVLLAIVSSTEEIAALKLAAAGSVRAQAIAVGVDV